MNVLIAVVVVIVLLVFFVVQFWCAYRRMVLRREAERIVSEFEQEQLAKMREFDAKYRELTQQVDYE